MRTLIFRLTVTASAEKLYYSTFPDLINDGNGKIVDDNIVNCRAEEDGICIFNTKRGGITIRKV